MTRPFGRWLVALAGIGVMAAGLQQIWSGWTERFRRRLKLQEMEPGERSLALRSGKLGLMARGAVFVLLLARYRRIVF